MARQKSIIKLDGTIGGITFYKTQDGYLAKEKSEIPAERIANDPNFQRTRENGSEFGRAAKAGKTLRTSIRPLLMQASDNRVTSRLTQTMVRVIKLDAISDRGMRNVLDGELSILSGFEFNNNGKLASTFYGLYTATIDRAGGTASVDIPAYAPLNMINAPSGTTHYKLVAGAMEVDFEQESFVTDQTETSIAAWDASLNAGENLSLSLPVGSAKPLFLVFGVQFYQEVNGEMYSLKNGQFNPLAIVKIDTGV